MCLTNLIDFLSTTTTHFLQGQTSKEDLRSRIHTSGRVEYLPYAYLTDYRKYQKELGIGRAGT